MAAYNKLNGTHCSENKELLTDILRKRWGYEGMVVTDWGAVKDRAKGIAAGALGGKLLGAGGGGFLVLYVQPERQTAVRKAMEKLLYIPVRFENSGAQIIYYAPEEEPV